MTDYIEASVMTWLRYDRGCPIVCVERGLEWRYRPDILAVTKSRHLIEVEVKRTIADFRANAEKRFPDVAIRSQFYFAVPPDLADRIAAELPDGAGLITCKRHV